MRRSFCSGLGGSGHRGLQRAWRTADVRANVGFAEESGMTSSSSSWRWEKREMDASQMPVVAQ
jgi:hypothetical protein